MNSEKRQTPTIPPRTFVIGDIHGSFTSIRLMEEFVGFKTTDTIILLGDYIDRGPDSKAVLDWCIAAKKRYNLITLMGNHELLMHEAKADIENYFGWIMNGGQDTLRSFGCKLNEIPQKYWDFIYNCELYYETDEYIFVHGGLEENKPLQAQDPDSACWIRFRDLKPHMSGKTIICGHTPTRNKEPEVKPFAICLDTHVFSHQGYLTCMELNSGEYWQTSDRGEARRGDIDLSQLKSNRSISLQEVT